MKIPIKKVMSILIFILITLAGTAFFLELNSSRLEERLQSIAHEFKLVSELTADTISFGYFQWDDMFYALLEGRESEIQEYFEEIFDLSSFVLDIRLIESPPRFKEPFFKFSGDKGRYYCDFKVYDGTSRIVNENYFIRIDFDPRAILERMELERPVYLTEGEKGVDFLYGLKFRTTEPPILFFQIVSSVSIGLLSMLLLNWIQSRHRHFFYETRGLEKIIFLFERTEKYSADHSRRVATISGVLGRKKGFRRRRLKDLRVASLLHDIGKISVPVELLNKNGRLSGDEYDIIKQHVVYSSQIIENFEELAHLKKIILSHHEKMDGSGYPNSLKGHEIPLESRIIAVADIFEALIGRRPYRDPIEPAIAISIMKDMSLDEKILSLLSENLDEIMRKLNVL